MDERHDYADNDLPPEPQWPTKRVRALAAIALLGVLFLLLRDVLFSL